MDEPILICFAYVCSVLHKPLKIHVALTYSVPFFRRHSCNSVLLLKSLPPTSILVAKSN
jgi:hypothetical protein